MRDFLRVAVYISLIGSEDEELSLLEGFEPRERAGLVNDEGALEVAPLLQLGLLGWLMHADLPKVW